MKEKDLERASQALALRSVREQYHLSRSEIIKHGNFSRQTIYAWENGLRRVPRYAFIMYKLIGEKYGLVSRSGSIENSTDKVRSK